MSNFVFPALFQVSEEGYLISFPDLPEALSFARTEAEAHVAAVDCLREALRTRMRDQDEIPAPSEQGPLAHMIAPPAEMAAKAAVYNAFREAGLTRVALASKLDVQESEVRRILDPSHRTKLERLEQAAKALGGHIEIAFRRSEPVSASG